MRSRILFLPLIILSLGLMVVFAWTLTERVTVAIIVEDGICRAELYGRSSSLPCPGLEGGALITIVEAVEAADDFHGLRPPLAWLAPTPSWDDFQLRDGDGNRLDISAPLPDTFALRGRLRLPNETAAIVLQKPGRSSGWAFVPDGATRRGIWWRWENGQLDSPIQGIPLDKPLVGQLQSFSRMILNGWQGAVLLLLTLIVAGFIVDRMTTRNIVASNHRLFRWLLVISCLQTFASALYVSVDVLERVPHVQDSVTYLFQAQTLARGELTAPAPPLADREQTRHFDQEFLLVRDGRWFGKYPIGYPALLAVGVAAGATWLVNPLLATMTVPLVYALGTTLFAGEWHRSRSGPPQPATVGLLTALLLTVSPFFLIMSGSLMAHTAELFWTALFMLGWAKALGRNNRRWALVAGVAIGALFITRQFTAVTVAAAFGGGLLVVAFGRRSSAPGDHRDLFRLVGIGGLAAVPFIVAFFAYQAGVTGDPLRDPRLIYWPYDRVGFGPGFGESENVFTFASTSAGIAQQWTIDSTQPPRGNTLSLGLYNLGRNYRTLEETLFGWPALFSLSFVWLAFLLRRPAAADWILLLVVLAVAGGYVAYWAAGIAYGPRYFYAALPALALLTARGVTALSSATTRGAAAAIFAVLIAIGLLSLPGRIEPYRGYNFVTGEPRSTVEAAVATPALVFVAASELDWWEYGAFFPGNTPWLDGPIIFARDLSPAENNRLRAEFPGHHIYIWRDGTLTLVANP